MKPKAYEATAASNPSSTVGKNGFYLHQLTVKANSTGGAITFMAVKNNVGYIIATFNTSPNQRQKSTLELPECIEAGMTLIAEGNCEQFICVGEEGDE